MRTHLLAVGLVVLAVVVSMAAAQTRPKLPQTFEMAGVVQLKYNGSYYWGEGLFAADHQANKGVENIKFGGYSHLDIIELARYDLRKVYTIENRKTCQVHDLTGSLPDFWGWLQHAEFSHNVTEANQVFNVWRFVAAGNTLEATVPANDPTTLSIYSARSSRQDFKIYVQVFKTDKPKSEWFDVPKECGASTPSTFVPIH